MDSIANMFSQLKNASFNKSKETKVAYSKLNLKILTVLKNRGMVLDFQEEKNKDKKYPTAILVKIKYKTNKEPFFTNIMRISRSGKRVYIHHKDINQARRNRAEILVSTSKGLMSGSEAHQKGLGGELIGKVQV